MIAMQLGFWGVWGRLRAVLEPAAAADDNPFAMFAGWDSDRLLWLAVLIPVAIVVLTVGRRRFRSQLGAATLRPRGRDRLGASGFGGSIRWDDEWKAQVARLEDRAPTPVAEAQAGPVRIVGTLVGASGNLGGPAGRECVWRNRAGAGPAAAVAADLLIVADETGRCGVEGVEQARVIAPTDTVATHYDSTSVCIGDEVEVIGRFTRDVVGEHDDATQLVYGTVGERGPVSLRVISRPDAPSEPSPDDDS